MRSISSRGCKTRFECDVASARRDGLGRPDALSPGNHYLHPERLLMSREKFYITTPIFYPNGVPHIGHAYNAHRHRRAGALQAAGRLGRVLPDRHRRARPEGGADGRRGRGRRSARLHRPASRRSSATSPSRWASRNDDFIRTTEPRHYAACQEIWQRHGRHGDIYLAIRGLVLGPRRGLLRRGRTETGQRRREMRAHRRAGRMGRGGELLLPPVGLAGPAARLLRGKPDFVGPDERRNEVVSFVKGGLTGPVDLAHHLQLGHPGAGRSDST